MPLIVFRCFFWLWRALPLVVQSLSNGLGLTNLTCTVEESIPSNVKLSLQDVFFLLIRLNTLSLPALE